jgi:structure-specific endonuclease subunit SLX1
MLTVPPWNTWPLRVKLYSPEAVKLWNEADAISPPLPRGFTLRIELEGVDGKSGMLGSGRTGPIEVTDCAYGFLLS